MSKDIHKFTMKEIRAEAARVKAIRLQVISQQNSILES